MPSALIKHRGSGSALETSPMPVLPYQKHVVQQVVHSVSGSRLDLLTHHMVESSRLLMFQRDFKSLYTITMN